MLTSADTAYTIAVIRAREADLPAAERLFDDPFARLFGTGGPEVEEATQRMLDAPCLELGTRLRTRFIDDELRAALAAGSSQVLLLGAGFDARGLRISEIPTRGARVFEVDVAAQLERKRALLAAGGVTLPAWVAYVPCDFARPDFDVALAADLAAQGFRPGVATLVVWEGVIGYIDDAAIDRTLAFVARLGGPGTRLVFTYSAWTFDPDGVVARTKRAGFATCDDFGFDDVWRRHWSTEPHPFASSMHLGVARV